MPKTGDTLRGEDLGTCPFCGGRIGATFNADGERNGLVHSQPMCAKFEQLDPVEYITEVRKEIERLQKH